MNARPSYEELERQVLKLETELESLHKAVLHPDLTGPLFQTLIDTLPCPIFFKDTAGRYQAGNTVWCENIIGLPIDEIIGKSVYDLEHRMPNYLADQYHDIDEKLMIRGDDHIYEAQVRCANGELADFLFHKKVCFDSIGNKLGIIGVMLDISELTATKRQLQEKEQALTKANDRLEDILFSLPQGIIFVDSNTHTIIDVNPQAALKIGLPPNEIVGKICHNFICPNRKGNCPITDKEQQVDRSETYLLNNSGDKIPILKTVIRLEIGGQDCLLESFEDISELKRLENELTQLATMDSLTGIFNRRHFFDLTEKEIKRSQRYGGPLSLAIFDLDDFKKINDTYGHPTGDDVLKAFARKIKGMLRGNDIFGRIGGEEFAISMISCGLEEAEKAASRIGKAVAEEVIKTDQHDIRCTISVGVSQLGSGEKSSEAILDRADKALYQAKATGKNRVMAYKMGR
jgi:diguanylate cyclase (GGDEF)-like protein/PAS domain S-box-containing protein